jgi:beta-glucanase (GH16 family)
MHNTHAGPSVGAAGRREASWWCGPLLRLVGVSVIATALIVGPDTLSTRVDAAPSPVTIRTIPSKVVPPGAVAAVRPSFSKRPGVSVRTASIDVRRGATWVGRGMRSARLTAGTYRVTTKVTYVERGKGRPRTARRTQAVRVTTAAATAEAPASVPAAAPVASPTPTPTPTPNPTQTPAVMPSLARTSTSCDDSQLVKPDGTRWTCTFSDDFGGTELDRRKWVPQTTATSGYQIGADCFVDDPDNVSVGAGVLSLTVRKEAEPFACPGARAGDEMLQHTAGSVSTWGTFAQARGRFEFRAAFPATKVAGHHSALWLYPTNPQQPYPYSGEIDVAEMYSYFPDRAIPNIQYGHWDQTVTNNYCTIDDVSAFHTYTLEWTPTTMSIAFDGQVCVEHQIEKLEIDPFDSPFMLVLSQGLGAGFNAVTQATPDVGTTKVDYVRVWK